MQNKKNIYLILGSEKVYLSRLSILVITLVSRRGAYDEYKIGPAECHIQQAALVILKYSADVATSCGHCFTSWCNLITLAKTTLSRLRSAY